MQWYHNRLLIDLSFLCFLSSNFSVMSFLICVSTSDLEILISIQITNSEFRFFPLSFPCLGRHFFYPCFSQAVLVSSLSFFLLLFSSSVSSVFLFWFAFLYS